MNDLRHALKGGILLFGIPMLFGFTDMFIKDDVLRGVKDFVRETEQNMKSSTAIDGLLVKELPPYVPYVFKSRDSNPFLVKGFVRIASSPKGADFNEDQCIDEQCGDGPPIAHTPFFLENYALDELSMIGTMTDQRRGKVALIQTPDAGVVYAKSGEYIGQNNGLILSVNSDRLIIREKYRSSEGWQDRMARLPLLKN